MNKNSPILREFVKKVFLATKNENYTACCLESIKTEENAKAIIDYIDQAEHISLSDIEVKIMELTGLI